MKRRFHPAKGGFTGYAHSQRNSNNTDGTPRLVPQLARRREQLPGTPPNQGGQKRLAQAGGRLSRRWDAFSPSRSVIRVINKVSRPGTAARIRPREERSTLAREPTPPRPTPDQPAPDSPSLGRPPLPTGGLRARGGRRADETSVRHGLPPTTMQVHSLASRPVSSGWSHLRLSHARTRILPPPSRVSARAFARGSRPRAAWPRPAACRR